MAMQVKHMVTFGLGLGIATAFGYHFLSSPRNNSDTHSAKEFTPLDHFEIAEPPALAGSTPVPTQPQLDDHFRVEAQPLQSTTVQVIPPPQPRPPQASYDHLVSTMAPAIAAPTQLVDPALNAAEIDDSESSFSLDLDAPNEGEPEFVLDDSQLNAPEVEAQPTENMLQLQSPEAAASEDFELDVAQDNQTADEIFVDDETFATNSAQSVPTQNNDESFAVVVDYNSKPLVSSVNLHAHQSKKSIWKGNPFIDNTPKTNSATTTSPSADSAQAPQATISHASPPQPNSVLSLVDPDRDNLSFTAQTAQARPAVAIPAPVQPYQQQALASDQVINQPVQTIPQVQYSYSLNNADAQKAVHHIEYGKTLSRRGAAFTARQEFLAAMQVIASSNDKTSGDNRHSKALQMAMLSMREAKDFSVANPEQQIHMDVASVVESHRSQVLTPAQAANLSPVQAMNRYFAHAQEQLDTAGGRNVVSAEVFYCMGKLHTFLNRNQKVLGPYETAQSVVYHQTALLSDNQHHRSANELGVLLARSGRLEQSKLLFERSLMSQPTIRTWQNLAETHRRLGETSFANQAAAEVQILANSPTPNGNSNIQWKPVEVFNKEAPIEINHQRVAQLPSLPQQKPVAAPTKPGAIKTIQNKLKDIF